MLTKNSWKKTHRLEKQTGTSRSSGYDIGPRHDESYYHQQKILSQRLRAKGLEGKAKKDSIFILTRKGEKELKKRGYITHYFNNQPPKEGLLDLDFLTTTEKGLEEKFYFMGYDYFAPIHENRLEMQLKEGSIVKLPTPVKTRYGKALWMDSEGIVYVAHHEKPYADKTRRAIYNSRTKKSLI